MKIELKDIEAYLSQVKAAVRNNRYRISVNAKRQDNIELFLNYVLDEAKAKEILLSLINKLDNCFVVVISFHEQKHPLTYYFK